MDRHWFFFQNEQMYRINLSPACNIYSRVQEKQTTDTAAADWSGNMFCKIFHSDRSKLVSCVLVWVSCSLAPQAKYHKFMLISKYYRHLYSWLCEISRKTCLVSCKPSSLTLFDGNTACACCVHRKMTRTIAAGGPCRYSGYCETYDRGMPNGNLKDRNEELERGNDNN